MDEPTNENAVDDTLARAVDELAARFAHYDWTYYEMPGARNGERGWHWLGTDDEDVLVCIYRGTSLDESFHCQDFFFFNYAFEGSFTAVSQVPGHVVHVEEGEMVAGQPYTGYALKGNPDAECTVVGVLIRKELFYRSFLPLLKGSIQLMCFFLEPEYDVFSNSFLHLKTRPGFPYRRILNLMIVEYAQGKEGSQAILRSLSLVLTTYAVRQYEEDNPGDMCDDFVKNVRGYLADNISTATLKSTAAAFGYHPNYFSTLVRQKSGMTFSQLQLEERMKRADMMLRHTTLSNEEVAFALGYSNPSNFYKAFKAYYGETPREYGNVISSRQYAIP